MIIRYNKCMAKKSQSLVSTQDDWLTIQKPLPEKRRTPAGNSYYESLSKEEELIHKQKKALALTVMSEQLTQEFSCDNPSEKMLVKMLEEKYDTRATIREQLTLALDGNLAMSNSYNLKRIYTLEKALDRCDRSIMSMVQSLKAMKRPSLTVQVMGNAVIGNNQQFNNQNASKDDK